MNELGLLSRYLPTELAPPEDAWDQLVKVLDNTERSSFKKMERLEIEPPLSAWENIALALDKQESLKKSPSFSDVCLAMEVEPPPFTWQQIEKSLTTEPPIIKIGSRTKIVKTVAAVLAIAACLTGIIFSVVNKFETKAFTDTPAQVATVQKEDNKIPQQQNTLSHRADAGNATQASAITRQNNDAAAANIAKAAEIDSEKIFDLKKYNPQPVVDINTTNNKVASKTGKLRDANGNIIDRLSDHITSSGYIAAIGPNGNSVNVSTKLANMIEFFQEDSTEAQHEEYLDKVMRESNVWRQKLIDWRKKVDAADAIPSQMNFLDPIDLIRFFQKNK